MKIQSRTRQRFFARTATASALLMAGLGGCAAEAAPGEDGSCVSGKCDGFGDVRVKFKNLVRAVDDHGLDGLVAQGSTFADDAFNALAGDFAEAATELYGLPGDAIDGVEVESIAALEEGLATRFGENGLTKEVVDARQAFLEERGGFYAESSLVLRPSRETRWDIGDAIGIDNVDEDANAHIGFDVGAELETDVVVYYGDDERPSAGFLRTPVAAAKELRGFVFPRSYEEVRQLDAGEAMALGGTGSAALSFGASIPLVAANVAGPVSYNVAFSAALQAKLEGRLDVQLVRLGDEVVVDVGMSKLRKRSVRFAVEDRFGVTGLGEDIEEHLGIDPQIDLGVTDVDLGALADKTLRKALDEKLDFVTAEFESSRVARRLTVARFRFALPESPDEALAAALSQALRGDVRLAQGLAQRDDSGVRLEFDLAHAGVSSEIGAGLKLFGMRFYREREETQTSAVIQGPEGAQVLLFDTLERRAGLVTSNHGFDRQSASTIRFARGEGARATSEANLAVVLFEDDTRTQNDKLLDHVDALLMTVGGPAALAAIEPYGNTLREIARLRCKDRETDLFAEGECSATTVREMEPVRARAMDALRDVVAGAGLDEERAALVEKLASIRLAAQSVYDRRNEQGLMRDIVAGVPTALRVQAMLDDGAVDFLFSNQVTEERGRDAFRNFLRAAHVDRSVDRKLVASLGDRPSAGDVLGLIESSDFGAAYAEALDEAQAEADSFRNAPAVLDRMVAAFSERRAAYRSLLASRDTAVAQLGQEALVVALPIEEGRVELERAALESYGEARAALARDLFDELVELSDDIIDGYNPHPEMYVLYSLLGLLPPEELLVGVSLDIDTKDWSFLRTHQFQKQYETAAEFGFESIAATSLRGEGVQPIEAGLFSVEALSELP